MPIGRLTKKIHGQVKLSTIHPPSVGPIVGPMTTPKPKMAAAIGRSFIVNVSKRMDCDVESSAPPPMPCMNLKKTSSTSVCEFPQKNEAAVNSKIENT